jgi:hypothetical protein
MARPTNDQRFERDVINFANDILSDFKQMAIKYEKLLRDELNYIAESSVDAFYEDYEPSSYQRYGDIYNTYKITVYLDQWEVVYDIQYNSNFMKYHEGKQGYLFDIVFKQGWHGGADEGLGHPEPGIPWYRNLADQGSWLCRAARSNSPYEEIEKRLDNYIPKWEKQYQNELSQYLKKKTDDFKEILRQAKRRKS